MRSFEIHMPYPDDSVLTDEAVAHLVGKDINIDRDGDLIPGTIVKAVNLPAESAYRITIEEDENSVMELVRHNVFDDQQP